jgi:hypothetical protein
MAISIHSVILAVKMAFKKSKDYTDQKTSGLVGGVTYKGAVSYYSDLENLTNVEEGFAYTVKYAGTSGTTPDGTEYVWGYDTDLQALAWIDFSKDSYTKAQTDEKLSEIKVVTNRIIMDDTEDTLLFVQATQPTGNIPEGSIWINTAVVNP